MVLSRSNIYTPSSSYSIPNGHIHHLIIVLPLETAISTTLRLPWTLTLF